MRLPLIALLIVSAFSARAEQASMSDSFVNIIAVQTHIASTGGNYGTLLNTWVKRVADAGIRHLRDNAWDQPTSTAMQNVITTIHGMTGLNVNWIFTQGASCTDVTADSPTNLPGWGWTPAMIDMFEGMNEIGPAQGFCGSNPSPTWYAQFAADASYLHTTVAGMGGGWTSIPVASPSLDEYGRYDTTDVTADATLIGNISSSINYGTWHVYCSGYQPTCWPGVFPSSMMPAYGSQPFVVTETGYATWPGGSDVSVASAGNYYSRLFFEWFNQGAVRVSVYELLDDTASAGNDANFGLLYSDGTPKPAFTAIANEIALLTDPGSAFTPGNLNYSITNNSGFSVSHTLLQKRNGVYYLALWEPYNWNDYFLPASITVNLPANYNCTWYLPQNSNLAQGSAANTNSVGLTVTDNTLILEIAPVVGSGTPPVMILR